MNKFYGAHDQWTDLDKQNDVLITSIDGVIDSVKVNGEDYGGSSSDFSTAEVTIVGGAGITLVGMSQSADGYIFIITDENGDTGSASATVAAQGTTTLKALLFKNLNEDIPHAFYAFFGVENGSIDSVDGDCEYIVEEDGVLIWGDCTITAN